MTNPNILSERYATPEMNTIFSEEGKTLAERELWIAVMKAQRELGLNIPAEDIARYEAAKGIMNLERIEEIERRTRHDVKGKIEGFNEAAGVEKGRVHQGMTSRDLTDNVEQMQILQASRLVFGKYTAVLRRLLERSDAYRNLVFTARTHHQPAQPTLLGRRFVMWGEELCDHLGRFEQFIATYPLRGIKGAVGTQEDMLTLLGSAEKVAALEKRIAEHLGFGATLLAPGQVYPRSMDYALLNRLAELSSAPTNYARNMRLMAGAELVTEGFKEGQVGSSAMPHKMNTRSSERICGFNDLLQMYASGGSRLSGHQWGEGDVSCSVVRRVLLPDAFYASDGLCETTLTVLKEMGAYPAVISAEVDRYLPFLATTQFLMCAVQHGVGREEAHAAIKKHAVDAALAARRGEKATLVDALAADQVFVEAGIGIDDLRGVLRDPRTYIGLADEQISTVFLKAKPLLDKYQHEAAYAPQPIR